MVTAAESRIRLHELVLDNGRSASPYVWRTRYALAHKGLAFDSVPLGFTEIPKAFNGRFKTLPVLEMGGSMLAESWDIAEHLDREFPHAPRLFSGPAEYAMVRLFEAWFLQEVVRRMFGLYALDVHNAARPEDRSYYRRSREARVNGTTLEDFTAERASRLPAVREALNPLRTELARSAFLGGATPNYADYIALGAFYWAASVSTLPLLARGDDVMRGWLERSMDLYGAMGRDPRLKPLFE
jgi:glutathione S-transferase